MRLRFVLVLMLLFGGGVVRAETPPAYPTYETPERVAYINQLLEAFSRMKANELGNIWKFLRAQNRYACSSPIEQLRIQCLIDQARASCSSSGKRRETCVLVSDVLANNMSEEKTFLTRNDLLRIVQKRKGGGDHVMNALNGRYGRLAVEFLAFDSSRCSGKAWNCLSPELDRFCMLKANHRDLGYQGCVGALAWYLGSHSVIQKR